MEKINFSTSIRASKDKVWKILWDDDTYRKWTSVFSEGSHAVSDWEEGSKILFLDSKGSGMVSKIEKKTINEFMSFNHLGEVKDGIEDINSDKVKEWSGAHENYSLSEINGITNLAVDVDINDTFKDFFMQTFPQAMEKIKELAEG